MTCYSSSDSSNSLFIFISNLKIQTKSQVKPASDAKNMISMEGDIWICSWAFTTESVG